MDDTNKEIEEISRKNGYFGENPAKKPWFKGLKVLKSTILLLESNEIN